MYDPNLDGSGGFRNDPPLRNDPPRPPGGDPFIAQLNALYQKYYQRDANADEIAAHRGNPGGLSAVEELLKSSIKPNDPTDTGGGGDTPPPTVAPNTSIGSLIEPFRGVMNTPPPVNLGGKPGIEYIPQTPEYTPPGYTPPPAFEQPTSAEVEQDPGYTFGREQGIGALMNNKAALGVANTGGSLKDLIAWAGNFAKQWYGDVYSRKADVYDRNYRTQYTDPYGIARQSALDAFAPKTLGYTTEAAAGQHQSDANWQRGFDKWWSDFQVDRTNKNDAWNKLYQYATT